MIELGSSPSSLSSFQRGGVWFLILGIVALFFYTLSGILVPFIIGIIVAYTLSPAVYTLERYKISRGIGSFCVLSSFFFGISGLFFIAFPFVQEEILSLAKTLPSLGLDLHTRAMEYFTKISLFFTEDDWIRMQNIAKTYLGDILSWFAHLIANLLTNSLALANIVALIVVTPLVSFYFLKDWPRTTYTAKNLIPPSSRTTILGLLSEIDRALAGFARGQALVSSILAFYYGISLSLTGLHSGFAIGLLTGFFSFIPYVGFLTGFLISMIIAFVQFDTWTSYILIASIFLGGQILEGNFLTPRLVGERIGLHPIWVIFAVFSGAYLMGFLGILIAMPTAAILGVLFRFLLQKYRESFLYQ